MIVFYGFVVSLLFVWGAYILTRCKYNRINSKTARKLYSILQAVASLVAGRTIAYILLTAVDAMNAILFIAISVVVALIILFTCEYVYTRSYIRLKRHN